MKLFRLLGASERQGFGGSLIYKTAVQNEFRGPEITTDIEHTELKIWNIDLADSFPDLSVDEKSILRHIVKSGLAQSVNMIRKTLGMTEYKVRKGIEGLEERSLIRKIGNGPSTKYIVEIESIELLTQLQMAMEKFKKQITENEAK